MPPSEQGPTDLQDQVTSPNNAVSHAQRVVKYCEELIFDRPLRHLILAIFILDLLKNGVWKVTEISDWAAMAKVFPGRPDVGQADKFILSSPLGPAVAHYFGATSNTGYELFSFVATIIAVGVVVLGLYRAGGRVAAGVGLVALFASPLSNTLLTWLGKEDPFLILFTALAVLFENPGVACLAGIGLAAANPEAGAIIVLLSIALRSSGSRSRFVTAIALMIGLGIGCGGVAAYDSHIGATFGGRLSFVQRTGGRELIHEFLSELATWMFSVFGAYWVCIFQFWERVVHGRWKSIIGASALGCLVITLVSEDQTRIAALVSFPLLLWFVLRSTREVQPATLRTSTAVVFLFALAIPRVVVQAGSAYVSHIGVLLPSWL